MAVQGVFASDQNIPGSRKGDFASTLLQVMPTGSAPLLALSSGMATRDAKDTIVTWFEENHISGRVNVTDDNTSSDTTLTVDDASSLVSGTVMLVESTGEYLYVESVSGNVLTITRALGGSPASAINGSGTPVPIQRIGTAHEEGSGKPTAVANLGYPRLNYVQLFRNAWDVTGTAKAIEFHTGDLVAKNKADAGMFHAEDIERSMLWGKKAIGTLNGKPFRTMDGIITQIQDSNVAGNNVVEAGGTTWTELDAFLQSIFERNIKGKPNERIAWCGNTALSVINGIARLEGTVELTPGETEFGLKINKWMTPYGDVTLMTHPLMNESPFRTKELYVMHPGAIETRWLRRTHEDMNDKDGSRQGADLDFGVLTSELSICYKATRTGGTLTGMTVAAQ